MDNSELTEIINICNDFLEATLETAREKKLKSVYATMRDKVAEGFKEQEKVFLENFPKLKKTLFGEALGDAEVNEELGKVFNLTDSLMLAPINEAIKEAIKAGGIEGMKEFGEGLSFNVDHPEALEYINKRGANAVSQINETTRKRINRIVTDGLKKGKSYDRVAKEISEEFKQFRVGRPQKHIQSRAHHVAITETGEAYEKGNNIAADEMEEMGLEMEKHWVTVGDSDVSEGCATNEAEGWIKKNQSHNSGHQHPLRFPGCRCHEQYRRNPNQKISAT